MPTPPDKKNPAAVALGRLGGLARAKVLHLRISPAKRKAMAAHAARARWAQYRAAHKPQAAG